MTNVYVIGSTRGPKKIGLAANPTARLRALRTGHSRPIELLYSEPLPDVEATDIERRAHWLLRDKKTHGEWFAVSAKAAIDALKRAVAEGGEGEKDSPLVGRPPLKRNTETVVTTIRLSADVAARIDELAGPNKRGEFIREAVERELRRITRNPANVPGSKT